MQHRPVPEFSEASVATAGAYVLVEGSYLFGIGPNHSGPTLAVYRMGGHRGAAEPPWVCAAREVAEEAGVGLQSLAPPATYWLERGCGGMDLRPVTWPETARGPVPLLVASARRASCARLSVMYLARAVGRPAPSAEVRGLLMLKPHEVHRIAQGSETLGSYLRGGGDAILLDALDEDRRLEPFLQLLVLSQILRRHESGLWLRPDPDADAQPVASDPD